MFDKYVKLSDVKRKMNYIFRQYGVSPQMKKVYFNMLERLPYTVKGELETTLKDNGNWISIKDKLPDIGNCVLVTDGESIEMCSLHETANGMMWYSESPECYGEILYWQPLPDISAIYQDLFGSREENGY